MNPISEARTDIKTVLSNIAGLTVYDHFPERLQTERAAVITPDDPYVIPGQTIGSFEVGLRITLLVRNADNAVVTTSLDELIVSACDALRVFGKPSAAQPYVESSYEPVLYLGCQIAIKTTYEGGNN